MIHWKNICTRAEEAKVILKLDYNTPKRIYKKACKIFDIQKKQLLKGEIYEITYRFSIEYFDDVEERLKFITKLMKKGYSIEADMKILNYKICLIQEFLREIEKIKAKG